MRRLDTQPNRVTLGPSAEGAPAIERMVRVGDAVICTSAGGEDLPTSGTVMAIRSRSGEHAEYVVQVGANLLGVYLIEQLALVTQSTCPSSHLEIAIGRQF